MSRFISDAEEQKALLPKNGLRMSQAVANLAIKAKEESEKALKLAQDTQSAMASLAEKVRILEEKIGQSGTRNNNR